MGVLIEVCFVVRLLYVHSSFAIILMGKREPVALLGLFSWCLTLVMVVWLFLAVPWVCLGFVIVVFPDHTHYFCHQMSQLLLCIQAAMVAARLGIYAGSTEPSLPAYAIMSWPNYCLRVLTAFTPSVVPFENELLLYGGTTNKDCTHL